MTSGRDPRDALRAYALPDAGPECRPVRGGHINETWRAGPWVLQRMNPDVFPDGKAVMENVLAVTRRLAERSGSRAGLRLVPTCDGRWWHTGPDGAIWRLFAFVAGDSFEVAPTPAHAEGAARAFGEFARTMADPILPLHVTMPGFHDSRRRLAALAASADRDAAGRATDARGEIDAILAEHEVAAVIPDLLASGQLPLRVAHNDAKIANVIFETGSSAALAVIDLDTTMPGSPLHDFGDLVRSMVSPAAEDAADPETVLIRHDYFARIARGFLAGAGGLLTSSEREMLLTAARSIALEQAARFLTDHLDGDRYYAVTLPAQNRARARTQLALYRRLSAERDHLEALIPGAA
jgi:hypothetical protein